MTTRNSGNSDMRGGLRWVSAAAVRPDLGDRRGRPRRRRAASLPVGFGHGRFEPVKVGLDGALPGRRHPVNRPVEPGFLE
jgi:hypothetical protein